MISDANSIDIMGERNDGGIDLYIISSGKLDDSVEQQNLLLDKIENYLMYLNSSDFVRDFPNISNGNKHIKLKIAEKPSDILLKLFRENYLTQVLLSKDELGELFSVVYST